jgi:hypothetical protein
VRGEAAVLRTVDLVARAALGAAVTGAAVGLPVPEGRLVARNATALVLLAVAAAAALGCLYHGARNAHERGRATAAAALAIAFVAGILVAAAANGYVPWPAVRA